VSKLIRPEYQKAINDCDQAITLNPNDAISFANRGFAYRHLGKEEKAIKDFHRLG
jgi:regulator of sirC expression with transglutaminase-like and TPR domain